MQHATRGVRVRAHAQSFLGDFGVVLQPKRCRGVLVLRNINSPLDICTLLRCFAQRNLVETLLQKAAHSPCHHLFWWFWRSLQLGDVRWNGSCKQLVRVLFERVENSEEQKGYAHVGARQHLRQHTRT